MAIEITVPRLGWSMEEGLFAGWLKADGAPVSSGEPLFALESDKVTMEVESLDAGILHIPATTPQPGATVTVGQRLGYLLQNGELAPGAIDDDTIIALGQHLGATQPAATPYAPNHSGAAAAAPTNTAPPTHATTVPHTHQPTAPSPAQSQAGPAAAAPANTAPPTHATTVPHTHQPTAPSPAQSQAGPTTAAPANTAPPTHAATGPQIAQPTAPPPAHSQTGPTTAAPANTAPPTHAATGPQIAQPTAPPPAPSRTATAALPSHATVGTRVTHPASTSSDLSPTGHTGPTAAEPAAPPSAPSHTFPVSPRARAAAKALGINLANVQPRPGANRIVEADVLNAKPKTQSRLTIAARMEESFRAPHFYLHADANVEALAAIRHQHRPAAYNDFLLKAIAIALTRHPRINAYWDNGAVVPRATQHVALATQLGDTLTTPVIRDAAEKTVTQIAAARATATNTGDASATLTNLGAFGVDRFEAILNPPQSIIVAVGKIAKRPVVNGDAVVARLTMPISLSVDHRVADGVPAAQFLQTLIGILESPAATYNEWE